MRATYTIETMTEQNLVESVSLFIATFSKEPWYDVYESREEVLGFFRSHLKNNYFLEYVLKKGDAVVALSLGFQKPWLTATGKAGMEYYIDQFCVSYAHQGQGLGSKFMQLIEAELSNKGITTILLNTEVGYPAEKFYLKNGFQPLDEFRILAK